MRLATIKIKGEEIAAIVTSTGIIPIKEVNDKLEQNWSTDMLELINLGQVKQLNNWYRIEGKEFLEHMPAIATEDAVFAPLYRKPRKIWGIGLNYVEHASDLAEKTPNEEPASFMKPDTTIIGQGNKIEIPWQSQKTTAESELGVIIGTECKDVNRKNWLDVVAGFTTVIDMTAEDILRKNPRYLTRAKSFDTFFSFGPHLVTPDEVDDVMKLQVATVINGRIHAQNVVANMIFPPDFLVSFHSQVMRMLPGDIISTGTPRAVHIKEGDVVECRIEGFGYLVNPVIDLKLKN